MNLIKDWIYSKSDIDIPLIAKNIEWKSGRFVKKLINNAHNIGLEKLLDDKSFIMTTDIILDSIEFTEAQDKKESVISPIK